MIDNTELKRLVDRVLADLRFCGDENHKALADGVLALIAENERLSDELSACTTSPGGCSYWREAARMREQERDELRAENAGLRTGYEAYEQVVRGLKAEVEAFKEANAGLSEVCTARRNHLANAKKAAGIGPMDDLVGAIEAMRKARDARHPFKPFHEPAIGFTGCMICGMYTDHGGLPCPKTRATADAAMGKGEQS